MQKNDDSGSNDGERVFFPNYSELLKDMYFKTETAWANAFKEYVGTETFVRFLDQALEQHLSMEKVTRSSIDKYFENSPLPSKKDVARIAELVIAVEDKVDGLVSQFAENLHGMADSLLRIREIMEENQEQVAAMQKEILQLNKKVDTLSKKVDKFNKETKPHQNKTEKKEAGG